MTLGLPVEIQGHFALVLAVFPIPHASPYRTFQCTTCALTQLRAPNSKVVYWRIIQKNYSCCKISTVQWEWINKYLILSNSHGQVTVASVGSNSMTSNLGLKDDKSGRRIQ